MTSDLLTHLGLLPWNRLTEFNEPWQEARFQLTLLGLSFSGRLEKQYGCPDLWLAEKCSTSPLKPLKGIQQNLTGSKISTFSTKFVFLCRWEKQMDLFLIVWDIFDFSSETAERNSTKPYRKQDLKVLYRVCVFHADKYTKMTALADLSKRGTLYSGERYMTLLVSCFNSPEPKAQVSYFHSAPSVVRQTVRYILHFQLFLKNCLMYFEDTW